MTLLLVSVAGLKDLWERVTPFLWSEDAQIRAQSAIALARLHVPESGQAILDRLPSERESWPRIQLADAAKGLKLRKAVPELIRWMGEEDTNIQRAASRALREITAQNFGQDRDKWLAWWETAK